MFREDPVADEQWRQWRERNERNELHFRAKQRDAAAQDILGQMNYIGEAFPQDYAKAVGWWRKAAEQEHNKAQSNLGLMYKSSQGVTQDYVQAYIWFNIAASSFPPGEDCDIAVKNRDIVAKKMTPAQISEAQKLAREWKPKK